MKLTPEIRADIVVLARQLFLATHNLKGSSELIETGWGPQIYQNCLRQAENMISAEVAYFGEENNG